MAYFISGLGWLIIGFVSLLAGWWPVSFFSFLALIWLSWDAAFYYWGK